MSNKILVITALLGDKKVDLPTFEKHKNCDYVMISDKANITDGLWEVKNPNRFSMDSGYADRRDAK